MLYWIFAFVTAVTLAFTLASYTRAESTVQRDAPTERFYTKDGRSAGSSSTYGDTTKFYDARGNLVGSSRRRP